MRSSSIFTGTTLGFMVLFASALITAPASTVHAQQGELNLSCDAPGANLQTQIDHAAYGSTVFFGGNCDDGPYFINAGQNLHLRGFSSGGTLSAPSGGDCVVCIRFAHVKFTRLDIDATGAFAGISIEGGTAEILDIDIIATGAFAGIRIFGGDVSIGPGTSIHPFEFEPGAENGILVNGGTVNISGVDIQKMNGVGIHVINSSHASIFGSDIEDGGGDGIVVTSSSSADIGANMITGNSGDGVSVTFHSSVSLGDIANTIEGNTAYGVRCGVSGALVVAAVPLWGSGNTAGNNIEEVGCELLDLTSSYP